MMSVMGSFQLNMKFITVVLVMMITTAFGSRDMPSSPPKNHQDLNPLFINVSSSTNGPPPPPQSTPPFNYYLFALQWPKSLCHVAGLPCDKGYNATLTRAFTVHGLWPKISSSKEPPKNNAPFVATKIQNYQDLETHWVNALFVYDPTSAVPRGTQEKQANERFWSAEWSKHGDRTTLSQQDYFNLVMRAYKKLHITQDITSFVGPDFGKPLITSKLIIEISSSIGVDATIYCNKDYNNQSQLKEIRFKLDASGSTALPSSITNANCATTVVIPA